MIRRYLPLISIVGAFLFLPGCAIIAGIFTAGMGTAIAVIILIVVLGILGYKNIFHHTDANK